MSARLRTMWDSPRPIDASSAPPVAPPVTARYHKQSNDFLEYLRYEVKAPVLDASAEAKRVRAEGLSFAVYKAWMEISTLAAAAEDVKLDDLKWKSLVLYVTGRSFNATLLAEWRHTERAEKR